MHSHRLDNFSLLDSPIHRLPAGAKFAATVIAILLLELLRPGILTFTTAAIFISAAIVLSRIPIGFLFRRLLTLEPFVIGVSILSLLQPHGGTVILILLVRSTLCLLIVLLLSNTTPFADLLLVLRRIHVPALMVTTLALMHRYLHVLQDEMQRMSRARASRSFSRNRASTWRNGATVIAQLFVRASSRADRIYAAMCSRGWQ